MREKRRGKRGVVVPHREKRQIVVIVMSDAIPFPNGMNFCDNIR